VVCWNALCHGGAERKRLDEQPPLWSSVVCQGHGAMNCRNPLILIAMAAYDSPPETRQHIQTQLKRAMFGQCYVVYSGGINACKQHNTIASFGEEYFLHRLKLEGVSCEVNIARIR